MLDQMAFSLASLLTTSIASHSLTPDVFGSLMLLMIAAGLVWMIIMNLLILPHVSCGNGTSISDRTFLAACTAVAIALAPGVAYLTSRLTQGGVAYVAALFLCLVFPIYESTKKLLALANKAYLNLVCTAVFVLSLLVAKAIRMEFVPALIGSYCIAWLVAQSFLLRLTSTRFSWQKFLSLFNRNGFRNAAFSCISTVGTQYNLILTSAILSTTFLGVMRIGQTLTSIIGPALQMLDIQLPRRWESPRYIALCVGAMYLLIVSFGVFLYFFWTPVIPFLFGPKFVQYKAEILSVYSVGLLVPLSQVQRVYMRRCAMYSQLVLGVTAGSLASIALATLLLNQYRESGAVFSLFASQISVLVFLHATILFPWRPRMPRKSSNAA